MKYMVLIGGNEESESGLSDGDRAAMYERIGRWWGEHEESATILGGHELQPSATATTVRTNPSGSPTVTDGPFVEGKEMIGGYAIIDVADLDAAIALVSSWPGTAATLEIRPIVVR
ncbi:MAG: YciI family protein [Candidatus Limnocylindria bacterium]